MAQRSFREMLDNTSDADLGRIVRDRAERLLDAHGKGLTDTHPAEQWNADNRVLRDHYRATRDARDGGNDPGDIPSTGNVGEAKEIERGDVPAAQDDPGEFPGKPPNPQRNGAELAAHDAARVANDAALRKAIPSLDRLSVPSYKGPALDEDRIVQVPRSW